MTPRESRRAALCRTIVWLSLLLSAAPLLAQPSGWTTFRSPDGGFQVRYPESWQVVVARPADGRGGLEQNVLMSGELYKVTFIQQDQSTWPGSFQITLLANPRKADLEQVLAEFDLSDLWEDDPGDAMLAGLSAKTWIRWGYDHLQREIIAVAPRGVLHVSYEVSNPNDPDMADHKRIYDRMAQSFAEFPGNADARQ
jgi:hypothetical protein